MIEQIRENLFRIPVPLPGNPMKELNSYLLKGKERSLVIDTGFRLPECRAAMEAGLTEAGADRTHLDVLVTHIHTDHTGLSADLVSPDGKVYISHGDLPWTYQGFEDNFWATMDRRFLKEGFPPEEVTAVAEINPARTLGPPRDLDVYTPVKDGDRITVGSYTLTVLETPGHTPGQICLWLEEEGILFTADHVLFDITPNIAMWPNLDNALGCYLKSLEKIRSLPVKLALPGHRHSGDLSARIEALFAHHRNRVAETLSIVQQTPGLTAYEITARMTWDIRAKNWDEFPLTQKWFAVGEALAHLDFLLDEGKLRRTEENGFFRYTTV